MTSEYEYDTRNAGEHEVRWFVGGGVVVVALLMYLVNVNTQPARSPLPLPSTQPVYYDYANHPKEAAAYIDSLAEKTNADFAQLTRRDQEWLNGIGAGSGALILKSRLAEIHKQKTQTAQHNHPK